MRIGIDIDGVLTNVEQFSVDYFSKYLVENNIDYMLKEPDYLVSKAFGVDHAIENDFWKTMLIYYSENEPARAFASEVIDKLISDGHEIYIITARWTASRDDEVGENMRNTVKNWLDKNNIHYHKLIFSKASKERKVDEISENKIDLMIEDSPNNILELSKYVKVICYYANYNRNISGKNIIKCYSWYDIYKTIKNLCQQ